MPGRDDMDNAQSDFTSHRGDLQQLLQAVGQMRGNPPAVQSLDKCALMRPHSHCLRAL